MTYAELENFVVSAVDARAMELVQREKNITLIAAAKWALIDLGIIVNDLKKRYGVKE